jgi:hypothetical protein
MATDAHPFARLDRGDGAYFLSRADCIGSNEAELIEIERGTVPFARVEEIGREMFLQCDLLSTAVPMGSC